MSKAPRYVLTRDVVIPAGTRVRRDRGRSTYSADSASVLVGPTKDTCFEWSMPFEDAVEVGLVAAE